MNTNGFVRLVDHMPQTELDHAIVQAARVSYSEGTKTVRTDEGLLRYLLRHWHTTPFEMVEFKFHIKMPMFVARQHMRHRTASINEMSGRYSILPEDFFMPSEYREQSSTNKQGSEGPLTRSAELLPKIQAHSTESFKLYKELLDAGCSRELARCHLPLSTYTEFYWKVNLHNLLHYLQLRLEPGAQEEIRWYAQEMLKCIEPLVPMTVRAFRDYRLNAIQLSAIEIKCIQSRTRPENKREAAEFQRKLEIMGLDTIL
jgi:thymidylate synthase (FAD)